MSIDRDKKKQREEEESRIADKIMRFRDEQGFTTPDTSVGVFMDILANRGKCLTKSDGDNHCPCNASIQDVKAKGMCACGLFFRPSRGENMTEEKREHREKLIVAMRRADAIKRKNDEEGRFEDAADESAASEYREAQARLHPEKLRLSQRIFEECSSLLNDEELMTVLGSVNEAGCAPLDAGVYIGGGKWYHRPDGDMNGAWSRFYAMMRGGAVKLQYQAGYKIMPTGPNAILSSPEELADMLSHGFLVEMLDSLETGKVYDTIRSWHLGRD